MNLYEIKRSDLIALILLAQPIKFSVLIILYLCTYWSVASYEDLVGHKSVIQSTKMST
jgi:hypothetical protein